LNAGRTQRSCIGAYLFVTASPCLGCARLIHHSGISRVYLPDTCPDTEGTRYLLLYGVEISSVPSP
jgi:deoxycytidylate deaminase